MNNSLFLHCCCAPCSVSCVKSLRAEGIEPELFWYNPNIHPYTEYKSRLGCLREFAHNMNLELMMIDEYGLHLFLKEVWQANFDDNKESRCLKCYKLRLEKTVFFAVQEGYKAFSTTLLISPYQNHEAIKLIAEDLASKYGIEFLYRDFRPLFREGQAEARSADMYMQKYCGCIFSEEERYEKKITQREKINFTRRHRDTGGSL